MWNENLRPTVQELVDDEVWPGPLGGHGTSLTEKHVKWMSNPKLYRTINSKWAVPKAKLAMKDHSTICYDWTKVQVKDRLTFRTAATTEQIAPRVFSNDRDGHYFPYAEYLRTLTNGFNVRDEAAQVAQIQAWIYDPQTIVKDLEGAELLTQYCALGADEFTYVRELLEVYDRARCYWIHLMVSEDINKLIKSRKIKATNDNEVFKWAQVEATILSQLTNVNTSVKIVKSSLRVRKKKSKATIWVAERMADRAVLERPPVPGQMAPCTISEFD